MRSWLSDLVGPDLAPLVSWVAAGAIVLALLVVFSLIGKKMFSGSLSPRSRGKGPRLAVLEIAPIDQKHKLVLVRRDDMEHLILVGGQNDVVVESSIMRMPQGVRQRGEPTIPDLADRVAPRATARPAQQRPAPSNGAPAMRDGEGPRVASPLTRPVPGQPVPVAPSQSQPQSLPRRPIQEPAALDVPPIDTVSPPSRETAEIVSSAPPPLVPPVKIESVTSEQGEATEPRPAEKPSPTVEIVARQVQPVPPVAPPAAPIGVVAPSPERLDPRPPVAPPIETAPVITPPPPAAERLPERAFVMPPRLPPSLPVSTPEAAPRRATSVVPPPVQPRSMATPTIPPKPAPEDARSSEPRPEETIEERKVPPTWATASTLTQNVSSSAPPSPPPQPLSRGVLPPFSVQMTPKPFDPQPAPSVAEPIVEPETASSLDRESDQSVIATDMGKNIGAKTVPNAASPASSPALAPPPPASSMPPSAPPINLSNLLGGRAGSPPPVAGPSVPADLPAPSAKSDAEPDEERGELRQPEAPVPLKPVFPVLGGTAEPAEKRPLSVRSFATTIQSRRNGDAPQQRVEPIAPPVPAAHAPTAPVIAPPILMPPPPLAAPPQRYDAGRPAPKPEADDGESLEDFLSAELDSDFGKQNWQNEDNVPPSKENAPAMPPVEKTPPPRALTLEEEMERLLGDFDFEVSDRKKL